MGGSGRGGCPPRNKNLKYGPNIDQKHQKRQNACRKFPGTSFSQKRKTLRARSTSVQRVGGLGGGVYGGGKHIYIYSHVCNIVSDMAWNIVSVCLCGL